MPGPARRGTAGSRLARRQPTPYAKPPTTLMGSVEAYVLQPLRWMMGSSNDEQQALPPPGNFNPAASVFKPQGRQAYLGALTPVQASTPLRSLARDIVSSPTEPLAYEPTAPVPNDEKDLTPLRQSSEQNKVKNTSNSFLYLTLP